jgi:LacI family transcriptional regulator
VCYTVKILWVESQRTQSEVAMNESLSSLPKYMTVAEAIESQIADGKWDGGKMPSVRGIATEHSVSVVTASRALQVLRDKGLIQTIERSGCYRVPPPSADRWAICLHLTTGPWQKANIGLIRSGFESLARRWPMHLDFDVFHLHQGISIQEAANAAIQAKSAGVRGLFMLPNRVSEEQTSLEELFLQGCRKAGLPIVLIERNIRGREIDQKLDYDLVTLDDVGGGFAATQHLYSTGRKRVGLVIASPTSSHNERLAGYLYAVHSARMNQKRLQDTPEVVLRMNGADEYSDVVERAIAQKLDGIVCYSDYAAVGVIMELLQRGIKIPQQVGVVGFDNLPIGELFSAGLTSYDYPAERLAEQAIRVMREQIAQPNRSPIRVVVPSDLLVRGSTVLQD